MKKNMIFTMMAFVITLLVGCGNQPTPSTYTLTATCTNGIVTGNAGEYEENADVALIFAANQGYVLPATVDDITISGIDKSKVTYVSGTGSLTFKMPANAVAVAVTATEVPDPLCFTCNSDTGTLSYKAHFSGAYTTNLEYSTDKIQWNTLTKPKEDQEQINICDLTKGQSVYIRGYNPQGFSTDTRINWTWFVTDDSSDFSVSGNIMSLINKEESESYVPSHCCFYRLFQNTTITDASELLLPVENLESANSCYQGMFSYCSSLKTAPALPATNLADSCYARMFESCTSLVTAPELPAETLAKACYEHMFESCTSLVTAPELPAETLAESCYEYMFKECESLVSAPALSAMTLADDCYFEMFYSCTSLETAPELPASVLAGRCYLGMFGYCSSLKTAPVLPATNLAESCYMRMFQECTSLKTTPELPATSLANSCYMRMFESCTSLASAPNLPSVQNVKGECYYQMFHNCTSLKVNENGTGTKIFTCIFDAYNSVYQMFENTGGTFTGTPTLNNSYYWYQ